MKSIIVALGVLAGSVTFAETAKITYTVVRKDTKTNAVQAVLLVSCKVGSDGQVMVTKETNPQKPSFMTVSSDARLKSLSSVKLGASLQEYSSEEQLAAGQIVTMKIGDKVVYQELDPATHTETVKYRVHSDKSITHIVEGVISACSTTISTKKAQDILNNN